MAKSDHLDPAQQASAASIPALRAVIAGVLKDLDRALATGRAAHVETALSGTRTLASACERLTEENERMREALVRVVALAGRPPFQSRDLILGLLRSCARIAREALTPAPAGKGEG